MAEKENGKEEYSPTSITTLAQGAVEEQFADALMKVMADIDDLNVEAKQKRTITIECEFEPDKTRQAVAVQVKVKTKLAGLKPAESVIFVAHDRTGQPLAVDSNYHQPELFKG
ncbi:MAG TPA: hypothetical protein VKS22_16185 [Candidatus Binataceae bacterium]|nr:hypothetical protein [Candidatus Binataceae bacterium]